MKNKLNNMLSFKEYLNLNGLNISEKINRYNSFNEEWEFGNKIYKKFGLMDHTKINTFN